MRYEIIRSRRRTVAIHISRDGKVVVRAPIGCPMRRIEDFIAEKTDWINRRLKEIESSQMLPPYTAEELIAIKQKAEAYIIPKCAFYASQVGVSYNSIRLKRQKTLWGSCSKKGNLNFNFLLAEMPDDIIDYVIVHELCHRKRMDHSAAFWREVGRILPDYKIRRARLKTLGGKVLSRVR